MLEGLGSMVLQLMTNRGATGENGFRKLFSNLITTKLIHKFWEQLQKTLKSLKKDIIFEETLKDFVGGLFLGKLTSLDSISKHLWLQGRMSREEAQLELELMETKAKEANDKKL